MTHQSTIPATHADGELTVTITVTCPTWPAKPNRSAEWCRDITAAARKYLWMRGVTVPKAGDVVEVKP